MPERFSSQKKSVFTKRHKLVNPLSSIRVSGTRLQDSSVLEPSANRTVQSIQWCNFRSAFGVKNRSKTFTWYLIIVS